MLNLRADALTAACRGNNQRGRPTTGSKAAHCLSPTGAQLTQPATVVTSRWNKLRWTAWPNQSQLTLCQVTGEEIATATKLLEKACQKLRGISELPPQRIIDLNNATRQLHQLSCILDSCTITASYEVSQAQKALSVLPRTEKGSSTSSEEHYANCRNSLTKMSCKSTRTHSSLMTDKAHVRLWEALSAVNFCRFTLAPLSHHVSPFNVFLSDATRQHPAGFWIVSMNLWAWCPCGCTLWSRGGCGEPWFLHCASVASWLTDCCMALCCLMFRFCFTLPYQSLRWYNVIISSCIFQLSMNWSADHQPCWFLSLCLVGVVCFLVFFVLVCFWVLVLASCIARWQPMDYLSIQFSSLLYHIVIMDNVATALIRWICTMQLSFRLDKRPGESHLALDGKKKFGWVCRNRSVN